MTTMMNRRPTYLAEIFCRAAVGIRRLYDAHPDLVLEPSRLDELDDERCYQSSDFVAIQHMKLSAIVQIVVNQTIGIPIKTTCPLSGLQMRYEGRG